MAENGMKISELPAASEVLDADVLAGVGGGITRKFSLALVFNYIKSKLSPSSISAAPASSITTVEATSTASKAYAVGDLLIYNDTLYRVTSAISAGGTITPGTNVTVTDVETQLNGKQNTINASGVLIGGGSGSVSAKTLDTSTLTNDNNHIPTSGVVKSALNDMPKSSSWNVNASGTLKLKFSTLDMAIVFSSSGLQTNIYCASSGIILTQIASASGISVNVDTQSNDTLVIENENVSARRIIILQINGLLPEVV